MCRPPNGGQLPRLKVSTPKIIAGRTRAQSAKTGDTSQPQATSTQASQGRKQQPIAATTEARHPQKAGRSTHKARKAGSYFFAGALAVCAVRATSVTRWRLAGSDRRWQ